MGGCKSKQVVKPMSQDPSVWLAVSIADAESEIKLLSSKIANDPTLVSNATADGGYIFQRLSVLKDRLTSDRICLRNHETRKRMQFVSLADKLKANDRVIIVKNGCVSAGTMRTDQTVFPDCMVTEWTDTLEDVKSHNIRRPLSETEWLNTGGRLAKSNNH